ncbi:MAG: hypothetical protein Q4Q58_02245 [Thermoplasmata archaeon]|nr:hypothetical protein [Thermoplasmata archaeon]
MGAKRAVGSFIAGIIMTIVLVVIVPILVDQYITGYIQDIVGDTSVMFLTSDVIVTILVWAVILGFMILLGAGGILRSCGVFGILGLIVAYYIMGDVTDALLPLLILCAMLLVSWIRDKKKEKKAAAKASDYGE